MKKFILSLCFVLSLSLSLFAGNIQVVNNSQKQVFYKFTFSNTEYYTVEYNGTGTVYQQWEDSAGNSHSLNTPSAYGSYYFNVTNGGFFSGIEAGAIGSESVTVKVYVNGQLYQEGSSLEVTYEMDADDTVLIEFS